MEINFREEQIVKLVRMLEDSHFEDQLREHYGFKQSFLIMQKLYTEALESIANTNNKFSFNCLAKAQHMKAMFQQV